MFDCSCCSKIIKSMAYETTSQNALEKSLLLSLLNLPEKQLCYSVELLFQQLFSVNGSLLGGQIYLARCEASVPFDVLHKYSRETLKIIISAVLAGGAQAQVSAQSWRCCRKQFCLYHHPTLVTDLFIYLFSTFPISCTGVCSAAR